MTGSSMAIMIDMEVILHSSADGIHATIVWNISAPAYRRENSLLHPAQDFA